MNVDLIEPINVNIEQIDKDSTVFNDGLSGRNFPANTISRKSVITLEAQVVFGDRDQKGNITMLGADEQRKGYMVIRVSDLEDKKINLKRGDKITKIAQNETELYLTHSSGDPAAHINGVFNLVRMFFEDRDPVGDE